jgi:membrane carboxypeptidase/penicillin-binding protein PbpC
VLAEATPTHDGLIERDICALSGLAANEWCPVRRRERLPAESELLPCSWHHLDDGELITIWPAEYHEWARERGVFRRATAPSVQKAQSVSRVPIVHGVQRVTGDADFRIGSPADGSTYLIDPTLRREFQALSLRVVSSSHGAVEWWIDGRPIARTAAEPAGSWSLTPGAHTFLARDQDGRTAQSTITVR